MMFYFSFPVTNLVQMTLYVKRRYVIIICLLQVLYIQPQLSAGATENQKPVNFHYLHDMTDTLYSQLGDINIGDVAGIYQWKNMIQCEKTTHFGITDTTEATKFAVDWVNNQTNLLPNVTLGFIMRGTCYSLPMTMANSLCFLPRTERTCNDSNCYTQRMMSSPDNQYVTHDVIGMIAPYPSTLAAVLSSLFSMARIPSVGYEAGSNELTSTYQHPYFFRVNTPDYYQILGILKFVSDNGWSYIQFVYVDDYYGRDVRKAMYDLAGRYGVCIAASHMLYSYRNMAEGLLREPLARVVIVFIAHWRFSLLLKQIHKLGGTGHFLWIGSDRMQYYRGFNYGGMSVDPGVGTFLIFPYTKFATEYFDYLRNIDIFQTKNPWLKKNWERIRRCSCANCPKTGPEKLNYNPERSASLRIDAILAFAHAAHPISWSHLNSVERLVPVKNDSLLKDFPESVCSRPCVVGEYKIEKDLPCCWDCLRCRENERLINENTECEACPMFQWPDPISNFTTCADIPLTYQTVDDPIPITILSVAAFVLTLALFVYAAYVKYRNERVIKASSKELSFIQLMGISGGYLTVILFQTTPTDIICGCIFFLFCMSFAMLYSPLLVKTVRIFRIFRSASENKKPRFISPQSQLTISLLLIAIQLFLCIAIYLLYAPGAHRTQPIWSEKMVELSCDLTIPGLSSFLGYNILLVSLCSVFAFMVRKLPDNYNESRFISMCVSTTLLIWMAFIPTYFTSDREYMRMFLLCMALLLNHSVAFILLFFLRIYAAMFMNDESLNFAMKK